MGTGGLLLALSVWGCAPSPRWIAVADAAGDEVVLYDAGLKVLDTVRVASGSTSSTGLLGVWAGTDGTTLHTARRSGTGVLLERVRVPEGTVLEQLAVPGQAFSTLEVLPDGRTVLLATMVRSEQGDGQSLVYALPADLSELPRGIAVCPELVRHLGTAESTDRLYAVCDPAVIAEVDMKIHTLVRTAVIPSDTGATAPPCDGADLELSPNGTIVYLLCPVSGSLVYVDRLRLELISSLPVGAGASRLARSPNGRYAAVLRPDARELVIVALRQRAVAARVPMPGAPEDLIIGSDSRYVYVAVAGHGGPGRIHKIDLRDGRVVRVAPAPAKPATITAWPGPASPVMRWRRPDRPVRSRIAGDGDAAWLSSTASSARAATW